MFLQRYGITTNTAMKIYAVYGKDTVKTVSANPYALIEDVDGIGFYSADKIARSMGVEKNGWFRARAGTVFTLKESARLAGNTFLPESRLIADASKLLDVDENVVEGAVEKLAAERKIKRFDLEEPSVMLTSMYRVEKGVATALIKLIDYADKLEYDCGGEIAEYEKLYGINFHEDQKRAISLAINSGVVLVTGGPGTGKTTIIKCILHILKNLGMTAALMAPTGRAAKRMSEATSYEAKTVHRLLEMEYTGDDENASFLRDEKNLLDENVFIIDEASMIDIFLFHSLLRAIKPGARLILIGDADQLPPVGAGNVLDDLICSEAFPLVRLTRIFRQSGESMIVTNAHMINEGKFPDCSNKDGDFFLMPRYSDGETASTVAELIKKRLPAKYGKDIAGDIQIITPSRKGASGTVELNARLQQLLNPQAPEKAEKAFGEKIFRDGDRVMQTKNNYSVEWEKDSVSGVGIFNGDIGQLISVDHASGTFRINFDGRICDYDFAFADELDHAYAVTVHKSQGSEYPFVIIPLYRCAPMLLTRNLIYTAITRASRMVILVGDPSVLSTMIENTGHTKRLTRLKENITEALGE